VRPSDLRAVGRAVLGRSGSPRRAGHRPRRRGGGHGHRRARAGLGASPSGRGRRVRAALLLTILDSAGTALGRSRAGQRQGSAYSPAGNGGRSVVRRSGSGRRRRPAVTGGSGHQSPLAGGAWPQRTRGGYRWDGRVMPPARAACHAPIMRTTTRVSTARASTAARHGTVRRVAGLVALIAHGHDRPAAVSATVALPTRHHHWRPVPVGDIEPARRARTCQSRRSAPR
jgi:hypothetical protein